MHTKWEVPWLAEGNRKACFTAVLRDFATKLWHLFQSRLVIIACPDCHLYAN